MKTIIVGAGPSGVAAAVQLTRMGRECLIFEKNRIGGLINNAWRVENSVFLNEAVSGKVIADTLKSQLERWKIRLVNEEVVEAVYREGMERFTIKTSEGKIFEADILVDATGTEPKKHSDIEKADPLLLKHCFYEIADMPEAMNGRVAVIGGGDAAFDYALNLSGNRSAEVDIFNRSSRIKSLGLLVKLAEQSERIRYRDRMELCSIGSGVEKALSLNFKGDGGEITCEYDYLLIATGRLPSEFSVLNRNIAQDRRQFWIIGDKTHGIYRQMTIAAGQGIETAMKIYDKIAALV